MSVNDMDFEGQSAAHFAVIQHQGFNKPHIVFSLVIPKEAPNHCNKAVSRCFLRPSWLLEEFLVLYDILYL